MKIKLIKVLAIQVSHIPKIILRTILFLSCTTIFGFSPNPLISQNPKITIDQDKTVTIYEVFEIIGNQTECTFIYQSDVFKKLPKIELKKGTIKVNDLLKECLPASDFSIITTKDNYITITRRSGKAFQQNNIKGVVTDSLGIGMAGVNIIIKNTAKGTQSDLDGQYTIIAHPSDTLLFTYIGFKSQEIAVGNRNIINVIMEPDATALDQVVINAGYYKVSDKEKTGSISRITAKDIEKQPVNNPLAAMQGRMPGVDIVQTSGASGGGFEVRIRGQNSISAGNEPLYIIDGVPYDSNTLSNISISVAIFPMGNVSPLNSLNPSTIESIEVLKDADATAIYGSRGANGVILITTKKGKQGKTNFMVNSSTGFANITRKTDLLNTEQYLEMRREAFANDGISEYPETAYDVNGTWDQNRYTDWQEEFIGGTAKTQNLQASVSGGSEQTQFLLSGMFQKETTVFPGEFTYDRLNVNSKINHRSLDKRFGLLFSTGYTIENNKLPKKDLSYSALTLSPNAPALYDENGDLNWENSTWTNPLAALEQVYKSKTTTLLTNAVITYLPITRVETKINLGYGKTNIAESSISPHTAFDPAFGLDSSNSQIFKNDGEKDYWIIEPQIEWSKSFANSELKVLVGATYQKNVTKRNAFLGFGFTNNQFIYNLSAAANVLALNENEEVYTYQSFFSRINYSIRDKIFLNLTGRRDGSSRFGPGNKYGNFGAIGAAWLFSKDLEIPWLNLAKLRGSYGITGNDQIGDYQYLQSFVIGDSGYDGNIGLEPGRLYNPNFKWEENRKAEVSLEFGFFEDRINSTVSYYKNRSSNQLIYYALPTTTGFSSILANLDAVVENRGWEMELSTAVVRNENFSWNTAINFTLPKNELIKFPNLENSTYAEQYVIGEPLSIIKLYKLKGVNPQTGLFEFEDYNGDGTISSLEDRQYIADLSPKFYGGLANSINYHNWSFDFLFQFVKKDGYNQFSSGTAPGRMKNQPTEILDRWQEVGDEASFQQFTTGANPDAYTAYSQFSSSSGIVSDASFIRLKSVDLSYRLPLQSASTDCKISLQAQNLITFTKFKGADPEQTSGYIPSLRRITLGVQLQF